MIDGSAAAFWKQFREWVLGFVLMHTLNVIGLTVVFYWLLSGLDRVVDLESFDYPWLASFGVALSSVWGVDHMMSWTRDRLAKEDFARRKALMMLVLNSEAERDTFEAISDRYANGREKCPFPILTTEERNTVIQQAKYMADHRRMLAAKYEPFAVFSKMDSD